MFTNSVFFILGLILSYKLVEKTFLNILITRLSDAWDVYDLRRAVVVVNLREGISAILVPLFAYVADVYTGGFLMVVFSSAVCITGLILNYLAAGNDDNVQLDLGLFYSALGLMALAQAAQRATLQAFFEDQFRPRGVDEDERQRHTKFCWTLVSFVAAVFAQFGPLPGLHFRKLAIVLTAVTGGCFVVFLLGTKYYNFVARIPNPFKDVWIVILTSIANRNVECQTQEPRVPWLRWLDRAAGAVSCSRVQVRGVKLLLKMLPLWSCFLTLSLVSASGSTFFFEEASSLTDDDDLFSILFLANLMRFTEFVASETSSYVVRKLRERKKYNQQKMELVRIGIGMFCCVLCCIAACATATRRQHDTDTGGTITMSVYWLTPQFFLLGLMGGLAEDGLQSFYESQVPESLSRYGPLFGEFVVGVGELMSIFFILVLSRRPFEWFQRDIDGSSLNNYYILLAVLSFVNVMIYCLVGRWYGGDAFLVEDEEMATLTQLGNVLLASLSIEGINSDGDDIQEAEITPEDPLLASPESTGEGEETGSCGDDVAESSGTRQEAEITPEDQLLPSESNMNNSKYNYVLLRAVTVFRRLSSRAARRRSDLGQLKEE